MNLLALLIGIILEYTATHLFHLRSPRLAKFFIPKCFGLISNNKILNIVAVITLLLLSVLPIFLVDRWLLAEEYILYHFIFAILVLFFSFGPHDLVTDVEDYQKALADSTDDVESDKRLIEAAMPLTEVRQHSRLEACSRSVTEGILTQGNKRFFAVIFWFLILGPTGAALFRVINSLRRESFLIAEAEQSDKKQKAESINEILRTIQGFVGWIPARLTALSYVLAGHFDSAMLALRSIKNSEDDDIYAKNSNVMAQTGTASLGTPDALILADRRAAKDSTTDALRLVKRSLVLWTAIIAILTLWGTVH